MTDKSEDIRENRNTQPLTTVTKFIIYMSLDIRFPKMWYVGPAKAHNQPAHMLRLIRAFASHLNIL